MEHRGKEFQVVQTANPSGWRWMVQVNTSMSRTGTSYSKGNAIFKAVNVIDKALAMGNKHDLEHGTRELGECESCEKLWAPGR
jgi:hypothetical protein